MAYELHEMDCRLAMSLLMAPNSVDSIVCDPPYGLSKEPDMAEVLRHWLAGDDYTHGGSGFMGKTWDSFVPGPSAWREAYRVLKPGGYLIAFFGTRTYDLGTLAIRLAGFEIRDQLAWVFGSGFPKSLDVSKAIDKAAGHERGMNPDFRNGPNTRHDTKGQAAIVGGSAGTKQLDEGAVTDAAKQWQGWGTALKPAYEPIVLARKPLSERTVAANVLTHGTGGLNVDACRVGTEGARNNGRAAGTNGIYGHIGATEPTDYGMGRWPANLCHDGSHEVLAGFPAGGGAGGSAKGQSASSGNVPYGGVGKGEKVVRNDTGSAARFFYCAKASKADRSDGNTHPTVKPTDLMRWLCRLVTPPGGTVLDPFTGSGSTGKAALLEGFQFVGCEMTPEYAAIARARLDHAVPE